MKLIEIKQPKEAVDIHHDLGYNTRMTKKFLFVDDIRFPPSDEWQIARNYNEAIGMLEANDYDVVSLDHDIASYRDDGREMTGYDVALWLVQRKMDGYHVPTDIRVHSANPVGVANIQAVINRYLK